jgi:hypothetical protein
MFGINENDLEHVLDACGYIFEQVSYFNVHDLVLLKSELEKIGFDAMHSIPFCDVWKKEGLSFTDKIKDVNIVPNRMESSSWRVKIFNFFKFLFKFFFNFQIFLNLFNLIAPLRNGPIQPC